MVGSKAHSTVRNAFHERCFDLSGQGSSQHLTEFEATEALWESLREKQAIAFAQFVHASREALVEEAKNTTPAERCILGKQFQAFIDDAESLLKPSPPTHSRPVVETTSLYIRQVLELMAYQTQGSNAHVLETSGLCIGIPPAILAATFLSYDSQDLVLAAVGGVRLAFWIGLRGSRALSSVTRDWTRGDIVGSRRIWGIKAPTRRLTELLFSPNEGML
ncbi:polyketide beta-ketoacyl-synthase [Conoideocrella luteorostrata]|uniref:Polyketide beta-ketoacyl-synthase n=1 Tax=Conoideocrella luteorostrata TaxID=1105319 RepID=A0AAJ0CRK3_9HYPO|nr:polyketide beta-ketoacyl-synthase [Conoideocrella luteorostrata]